MKKTLLAGLCIMGLFLPSWPQDKPASIEFLAFASSGGAGVCWEFRPDPTLRSNFISPTLLTVEVPPSRESPAIYLEIWGQYLLSWTSHHLHFFNGLVGFKIVSPALPHIEFSQGYGVPPVVQETNFSGNYTIPSPHGFIRYKGSFKIQFRRGNLQWWWIVDKNTGKRPSDDEALDYINKIIDNGFTVELWAWGTVEGLSYVAPFALQVEVTRIGKN